MIVVWIAEAIGADTGMDLGAYFIAGMPATIAAIGAAYAAIRAARHNAEVRNQVSNDHETNLRDDIDRLLSGMATLNERTARIGDELRSEVDARRDNDSRLRARLAKLGEDVARQNDIAERHHPEDMP